MATGGSKRTGPSPPPLSLGLASPLLTSESLQTPDTSSLFVSQLNHDHSPGSFASLEELLNVTGINTPSPTPHKGAGLSLQQLARDAEEDALPPTKQARLDLTLLASATSGKLPLPTANHTAPSIGLRRSSTSGYASAVTSFPTQSVLPLTSNEFPAPMAPRRVPASQPANMLGGPMRPPVSFPPHPISFPSPNATDGSQSVGHDRPGGTVANSTSFPSRPRRPSMPETLADAGIAGGRTSVAEAASQFLSRNSTVGLPTSSRFVAHSPGSTLPSPGSALPSPGSALPSPGSALPSEAGTSGAYLGAGDRARGTLPIVSPSLVTVSSGAKPTWGGGAGAAVVSGTRAGVAGGLNFPPAPQPRQSQPQAPHQHQAQPPPSQQARSGLPPPSLPHRGLSNATPTSAATTPSPVLSPGGVSRTVLSQMVQLYKKYQALGDAQGMARVKHQLNALLASQQKLAARSPGEGASAPASSVPVSAPTVSTPTVFGVTLPHATAPPGPALQHQHQQQQQQQQLSAVKLSTGSTVLPSSSGVATSAPSRGFGAGVAGASGVVGGHRMAVAGGNSLPVQSVPRTGALFSPHPVPPPLPSATVQQDMAGGGGSLAVSPSIIATSTAARANALKAAVTNYRLKQLRTYLNTLPLEQRPQNLQELREMLRNSSLAQGLPAQLGTALPLDPLAVGATPPPGGSSSSNAGKLPATFFVAPAAAGSTAGTTSLSSSTPSPLFAPSKGTSSPLPSSTSVANTSLQTSFPTVNSLKPYSSPAVAGLASLPSLPPTPNVLAVQKRAESLGGAVLAGAGRVGGAGAQVNAAPKTLSSGVAPSGLAPLGGSTPARSSLLPPPPPYPGTATSSAAGLPPSLPHSLTPSLISLNPTSTPTISAPPASQTTSQTPPLGPIQPGIPTPLPGLNLEALAALCKLPESHLVRLQLPPGLLTAIRVWKMRQNGGTGGTKEEAVNPLAPVPNDIPIILPPSSLPSTAPTPHAPISSLPPSSATLSQPLNPGRPSAPLVSLQSASLGQPSALFAAGLTGSAPSLPFGPLGSMPFQPFPSATGISGLQTVGATLDSLRARTGTTANLNLLAGDRKAAQTIVGNSPFVGGGATNTGGKLWSVPSGVGDVRMVLGGSGVGVSGHAHSQLFPGSAPPGVSLSDLSGSGAGTPVAAGLAPHPPRTQPLMIPPSQGFPPRSLHAYIPGLPPQSLPPRGTPLASRTHPISTAPPPPYSATHAMMSSDAAAGRPMTRFQARTHQQKLEQERRQAITKVLQSSEEARIAYRFNTHLEKMHSQLASPDISTPFSSLHDVIARLLPYHLWAEAESPPDAIEKADGVFESVAQVLLSRSQGLMSRYEQIITRDAEVERDMGMQMSLDRLFVETELERAEQEKKEKQQAEQIAADLSLIAGTDNSMTFDPDFSLSDVMNSDPFLSLDMGIT